jgi:hypothetical protein
MLNESTADLDLTAAAASLSCGIDARTGPAR